MARATRSSATQDKDITNDPIPSNRKNPKKRKRTSIADPAEQPALKQQRNDGDIKEEDEQNHLDDSLSQEVIEINLPSTGDVPIQSQDAENILQVLVVIDNQSLLDRPVPLPSEAAESSTSTTSASSSPTHTLRNLLQNASHYPMRTIRAVMQLLGPGSNPRSRPNPPELEQQRFCDLAISLLDQASSQNTPVPLNIDSIISAYVSSTAGPSGTTPDSELTPPPKVVLNSSVDASRNPKYALVQRLPTGDWWSSVDTSSALDAKNVPDLSIGRAELAAILPSTSAGAGVEKTLGEYITKKPSMLVQTASYVNQARRISCGKFLDYGPNASFAPSFDSDGREAGRIGLGEVIWHEERRNRLQVLARAKQKLVLARLQQQETSSTQAESSEESGEASSEHTKPEESTPDVMDGLLSPEQISQLKKTLGSLELEAQVDELLTRNAEAMARLELLQLERLSGPNGGSSKVEVGSEEWETAQGILDSLTTLASLRPRSSKDADHPPLIPTTSALRKLHRSLPNQSQAGYYGTLPAGRTAALRDDNTLYIRAGTAPTPAAPPTPVAPKTATPTPTTQYSGYNYAGYGGAAAAAGYRGGYGTYAPGQTATTGYYNYSAGQQTGTASSYYPNSQYNTAAQGQQQYSYTAGTWQSYQPQPTTAASSGHVTPQPATPVAGGTNYTTYYAGATAQQAQPQRAVTNTVLSTPTTKYQPANWPNGTTGYAASTTPASALPTHLRPVAGATQASGSYYAGYAAASPR